MRKVLGISLLFPFFWSCGTYQGPLDFKKSTTPYATTIVNNTFATNGVEKVYRAEIDVFNKQMSGLFVVKKMHDNEHRIVLTSDFGNTLFDFSIYQDTYKVHYVMPDLERKMILNFLAKDLRYLVMQQYTTTDKSVQGPYTIYQAVSKKQKLYIIQEDTTQIIKEVTLANSRKPKVMFRFDEECKGILEIEHQNIPLKMRMTPLDF